MSRKFNGSGDYFKIDTFTLVGPPCTLSAWIRPATVTDWHTIMESGGGTGINSIALKTNGTSLLALAQNISNYNNAISTATLATNTWYHVCGVFVSDSLRYAYVNGGFRGTDTNTRVVSANSGNTYIGRGSGNSPFEQYFSGLIAECTIWNCALSDAEVAALARGESPFTLRPGPHWSGLNAYYPLLGIQAPEPNSIRYFANMTRYGTPGLGVPPPVPPQSDFMRRSFPPVSAPAATARSYAVFVG